MEKHISRNENMCMFAKHIWSKDSLSKFVKALKELKELRGG